MLLVFRYFSFADMGQTVMLVVLAVVESHLRGIDYEPWGNPVYEKIGGFSEIREKGYQGGAI